MAKKLEGKVVSVKMNNTVVVEVQRALKHPLYKKIIRRHKKYKAQKNGLDLQEGEVVRIEETRPISKETHFKVLEKISK